MLRRATDTRWGWQRLCLLPLAALLLAGGSTGCVDEETVFAERPPFQDPIDSQNNFLGYVDSDTKLTSCGNCHATFQAGWVATGHAEAWAGLQSSDHAQAFCEGCHTISDLGNGLTQTAGYPAVRGEVGAERYQDVQCESCHGSGWDHVNDPTAANAPLCSALAATDATTGCGECHNGTHHPFVEQWELSGHANTSFASGRVGCDECHEGKRALVRKFFETSNYVEKNDPEPLAIVCIVCHDPHGTDFAGNLRAPIDVAGGDLVLPPTDHLCYGCHSRQGTPPSSHGPHAAQGPLVLQTDIGWIPGGFQAPPRGSHGSPSSNEELCVTCHVVEYEISDPETGGFLFNSVGHTFEAMPCLNEQGIPDPTLECEIGVRDVKGCLECHSNEDQVRGLLDLLLDDLSILLDQLWFDTDGDNVMDASDAGLLPQVIALGDTTDLDPRDNLVTVAEGAMWNAQVAHTELQPWFADAVVYEGLAGADQAGIHWSAHVASGNGVHNPRFLKALLEASIEAVIAEYGF